MVGDVMLLHGYEESYKSVFILQMAESLATGNPFLDAFPVSKPRVVGVVETENDLRMLGQRLGKMFPLGQGPAVPENLTFLDNDSLKVFRNQSGVKGKTDYIAQWVKDHGIEILMIDTVNDFFRGGDVRRQKRASVSSSTRCETSTSKAGSSSAMTGKKARTTRS